ncbi:PA14 domain-containing protein [Candidatus Frankia alpina]|uniref:PA14 domain-containing protein n=1 Tax=Candidatus Frankia alpina TaxID=2699483 RepID=UPI00196804F5|nr:PA14 domain-containing protein [Candidatus Frankia alpina]
MIVETVAGESGLAADVTDTLLSGVLVVGAAPTRAIDALLGLRQAAPAGAGWHGYLLPPAGGAYTFVVTGSDTQPAALTLDGAPVAFPHQQEDPNNVWSSDLVTLKAGTLYQLDTGGADVAQLQWRTATSPTTPVPASALLSSYAADGADEVFARVAKAAILIGALGLSADECAYLQNHGTDFGGFSFNKPTLAGWRRAHAYAVLRDARSLRDRVKPVRARMGELGWSASALIAVVLAVAVLLATGVLRVGPGDGAGPAAAPARPSAAPAYPLSAPLPLRGLVSLAARRRRHPARRLQPARADAVRTRDGQHHRRPDRRGPQRPAGTGPGRTRRGRRAAPPGRHRRRRRVRLRRRRVELRRPPGVPAGGAAAAGRDRGGAAVDGDGGPGAGGGGRPRQVGGAVDDLPGGRCGRAEERRRADRHADQRRGEPERRAVLHHRLRRPGLEDRSRRRDR